MVAWAGDVDVDYADVLGMVQMLLDLYAIWVPYQQPGEFERRTWEFLQILLPSFRRTGVAARSPQPAC